MLRRLPIPFLLLAGLSLASVKADTLARRKVRLLLVSPASGAPVDFTRPAGKSRWDLTQIKHSESFDRTLEIRDSRVFVSEHRSEKGEEGVQRVYSDPTAGQAAVEWFFPDRDPAKLRPGTVRDLVFEESSEGLSRTWTVHTEVVGIGWLHLPSRPYEVALQRCRLRFDPPGPDGRWEETVYRWVNNEAGVVAEGAGPAALTGRGWTGPDEGSILDAVIEGASTLRIYVSQFWSGAFSDVGYGWDRQPHTCSVSGASCTVDSDCPSGQFCGFPVSSLTTPSY